ncbi:MAG: FAD-binding oxidoreductase [Solirubrobacterales bacterium]|nr:FAD-binding oxidoreductase [Solirubrobacterales bacterium]
MPPASAAPPPIAGHRAAVSGWGGGERSSVLLTRPAGIDALRETIAQAGSRGAIARGLGRSYGDAAQVTDGCVLETSQLKRFQLDEHRGTVTAQAGVTIGELLAELIPAGFMVPVVPGTQHVTVGGAIASDIHGKNHGVAGTFGSHVQALGLLTAAGELLELEPGAGDGLFEATVGGMGLTGVIVWARIALRAVSTPLVSVDSDRVDGLDEALAALSAPGGPHRVAWLDLLGSRPGRGVVTRAEHLAAAAETETERERGGGTVRARMTVPRRYASWLLREPTVRLYNELRFRRAPRRERGRVMSIGEHMFPLDVLDGWPALYGRRGFVQYQLAVPAGEERALAEVIEALRRAAAPCFLAVLKDFGEANDAPLSFPIAGWTLALDLPRAAGSLEPALARCDRLVAEAGGRVYLSKDARLAPEAVAAMYPRLREWQAVRERVDPDRLWRSDLALRTGLVPGAER